MATNNQSPSEELPKNPSSPSEELPKNPSSPLDEEPPATATATVVVEGENQEHGDNNDDLLGNEEKDEAVQEEEIEEKPISDYASSVAATPPPTLEVKPKRPIDEKNNVVVEQTVTKRAKGDQVVPAKKSGFTRTLWSEADEVILLEGMVQFMSKGKDCETSEFYEFIKRSLNFDCEKRQLSNKRRKLKIKYLKNNVKKVDFLDAHDQKTFVLSNKLWGKEAGNDKVAVALAADQGIPKETSPKVNTTFEIAADKGIPKETSPKVNTTFEIAVAVAADQGIPKETSPKVNTTFEMLMESARFNNGFGLNESFMKEGMKLLSSSKKSELEEKWRKLYMAETEIFLTRIELVQEQTKLVLDSFKD